MTASSGAVLVGNREGNTFVCGGGLGLVFAASVLYSLKSIWYLHMFTCLPAMTSTFSCGTPET